VNRACCIKAPPGLKSRSLQAAIMRPQQPGISMNERLAFSPDEAAHRAGVGRTLIFSEIKHGRLEARKAGARTIITAEALEAWIKSLPVRAMPPPSNDASPKESEVRHDR
jgi:hypothetical protein